MIINKRKLNLKIQYHFELECKMPLKFFEKFNEKEYIVEYGNKLNKFNLFNVINVKFKNIFLTNCIYK